MQDDGEVKSMFSAHKCIIQEINNGNRAGKVPRFSETKQHSLCVGVKKDTTREIRISKREKCSLAQFTRLAFPGLQRQNGVRHPEEDQNPDFLGDACRNPPWGNGNLNPSRPVSGRSLRFGPHT